MIRLFYYNILELGNGWGGWHGFYTWFPLCTDFLKELKCNLYCVNSKERLVKKKVLIPKKGGVEDRRDVLDRRDVFPIKKDFGDFTPNSFWWVENMSQLVIFWSNNLGGDWIDGVWVLMLVSGKKIDFISNFNC